MPNWLDRVQKMWRAQEVAFGTPVTYNHASAGSVAVTGIYNGIHNEVDPDTGAMVASNEPTVGINISDLPAEPTSKDTVEFTDMFPGVIYRVVDSQEDGEGITEIFLHKVP